MLGGDGYPGRHTRGSGPLTLTDRALCAPRVFLTVAPWLTRRL